MAKVAPKKASAPKEPKAAPAPVASKSDFYKMLGNGCAEGKSGQVYKFSAGDVIEAPSGDLDHLGSRYCVKK